MKAKKKKKEMKMKKLSRTFSDDDCLPEYKKNARIRTQDEIQKLREYHLNNWKQMMIVVTSDDENTNKNVLPKVKAAAKRSTKRSLQISESEVVIGDPNY